MIGSDGSRFAAWQDGDVVNTFVYDAATRSATRVTPAPAGCGPTAIGAGALLANCDASPLLNAAQVLNLRSGVWRQVVPAVRQTSGFVPTRFFTAIGSHWIQAAIRDYHDNAWTFYSRATGVQYTGTTPYAEHAVPDLDRAALQRRLCAPLVSRASGGGDDFDTYPPPQVDGRFALDVFNRGRRTRLVLRHCGTRRHRVVCDGFCLSPVLDRGQVMWADDFGRLHLLDARTGHARRFVIRSHPITAVLPLPRRLILGTDTLFGEAQMQIRVTRRPNAARAPRRP